MNRFGHHIQSVKSIMHWAKEHLNTPENIDAVKKSCKILAISIDFNVTWDYL